MMEQHEFRNKVQILGPPLTQLYDLGKLSQVSEAQFSHTVWVIKVFSTQCCCGLKLFKIVRKPSKR